MLANANELMRATKGHNIILSSGCYKSIYHRAPFDLVMLGLLFGMTKD